MHDIWDFFPTVSIKEEHIMAKEMEVLFTETRRGQFKIGEQRKVKLGYARNYLLPQKLLLHSNFLY